MAQLLKSVEPTIWALRKNGRQKDDESKGTLYEHLYGYDPIRVLRPDIANGQQETIHKGSAENPNLNILNAETNFAVMELASELPAEENY